MSKIQIYNLELTPGMVEELTKWFSDGVQSEPESFIGYLRNAQDTITRLWCGAEPEQMIDEIQESLCGIIRMQDKLKKLIPERK
ncbi:MAG TPA: hypothetical protein VK152_00310 [Paludibacter sp.]|nr:hypothetical protein [Paludibacter sp.]